MSPEHVRPYLKAQKNDDRDAEAIAEAATRPTMRSVELKSEVQIEAQSLQRVRGRLVAQRTAMIKQLRALLLERGIMAPQGRRKFEKRLPTSSSGMNRKVTGRASRPRSRMTRYTACTARYMPPFVSIMPGP